MSERQTFFGGFTLPINQLPDGTVIHCNNAAQCFQLSTDALGRRIGTEIECATGKYVQRLVKLMDGDPYEIAYLQDPHLLVTVVDIAKEMAAAKELKPGEQRSLFV